jgi:S-DNA-T family DNA segregation ATPase FtsK/SpoIIIE
MAAIAGSTYYFQNRSSSNDHEKIMKIADAAGLKTKEGSIRIYRKSRRKNYAEYVYKIPLGLSFQQFVDHKQLFIDGLNNKSESDFTLANIKKIDWKGDIKSQVKDLFNNRVSLDKQIEMNYDGMLKFRVYEKGLDKVYLYNDEMLSKVKGWKVPIGYTYSDFITHDFEKLQMLVVAGMTRYGKTVFLKNAITTLINNQPDNVKLTLIDLKGGLAFNRFARCKQVIEVAKNARETIKALERIHSEMLDRQREFLKEGYEDITEAGYKQRHFIVIDEGAEISAFVNKNDRERCLNLVGEIARIGAGLGYRVVFATQYPTADVFPRQVKANTSAALCFKLKNATQSTVVLDRGGAEELPAKLWGRAIYQTDQEKVVQTPLIENGYIDEKIKVHVRAKEDIHDRAAKEDRTTGPHTTFFEEA